MATSFYFSPKGLLKAIGKLEAQGATALWKGGEIQPGNPYKKRLGDLTTAVNKGSSGNIPTADKFHDLLLTQGGFVLVIMIPVPIFTGEREMMRTLNQKHAITFDNYQSNRTGIGRVKKDWLPCEPFTFTF